MVAEAALAQPGDPCLYREPPAPELALCLVGRYLHALLQEFAAAPALPGAMADDAAGGKPVVEQVLDLLGSRRFTHLSRQQAWPYRAGMRSLLQADVEAGRPLLFAYDLGPGYHASLCDDYSGLRFGPGLGELLALRQIRAFNQAVAAVYAPGVLFRLVIDDLCAWVSNDVALLHTASYGQQLATLVRALGLQGRVSVLAESYLVSPGAYRQAFERLPRVPWHAPVSTAEQENVSRFVGRACTPQEASDYLARYQRAQVVSERVLEQQLQGVRLTQRATTGCLGFRAFAGSDARLQCGEVDVLMTDAAPPRPVLITRRNRAQYQRRPLQAAELPPDWPLPPGVVHAAVRNSPRALRRGSPLPPCTDLKTFVKP